MVSFVILRSNISALFKQFVEFFNKFLFNFVDIRSTIVYDIHTTVFRITRHTIFYVLCFANFVNVLVGFYKLAFLDDIQMSRVRTLDHFSNSRLNV